MSVKCPSCGASSEAAASGRPVCAYCGSSLAARLVPGSLCGDAASAASCSALAESVCRGCSRPLCTRHNDPRRFYWHEPLEWRACCPDWGEPEGTAWHRLQLRLPQLPVEGFEPFSLARPAREAEYRVGQLEAEILERLRELGRGVGADVDESAVVVESVCSTCAARLEAESREALERFSTRYRILAYAEGLEALEQELAQALRYVETYLGEAGPKGRSAKGPRPTAAESPVPASIALPSLGLDSPREDWETWAATLRARLEDVVRLRSKLSL